MGYRLCEPKHDLLILLFRLGSSYYQDGTFNLFNGGQLYHPCITWLCVALNTAKAPGLAVVSLCANAFTIATRIEQSSTFRFVYLSDENQQKSDFGRSVVHMW